MDKNLEAQYASLNDEELLHIAGDREDLREEAAWHSTWKWHDAA